MPTRHCLPIQSQEVTHSTLVLSRYLQKNYKIRKYIVRRLYFVLLKILFMQVFGEIISEENANGGIIVKSVGLVFEFALFI